MPRTEFLQPSSTRYSPIVTLQRWTFRSHPLFMSTRMFHQTTICQGDIHIDKNFVPLIKTRYPVVKAVKLMAWRQANSPLKITTWSGGQMLSSQKQLTNWDLHKWFCLPPRHQFDKFHHWGSRIYGWNKVLPLNLSTHSVWDWRLSGTQSI